jgi:tetratricopeptide (TPR) repeat protein
MAGNPDCYYVRRQSGNPVGPFSQQVVATMLKKGTLDGSEEVSLDRHNWWPVRDFGRAPPAESPRADDFMSGGTEVLSGGRGGLVIQSPSFNPSSFNGDAEGEFDGAASSRSGRLALARALEEPEPAGAAALELDADDLIPLELAPLELDTSRGSAARGSKPVSRDQAAPVAMLLGEDESLAYAPDQAPGSMSLLPTIRPDAPAPGSGPEGSAAAVAPAAATRHRTMSAVRQRPMVAPPVVPRRGRMIVAGGALLALLAGAGGFLAFGGMRLIFGEPNVAAVLAPVAADLDQDRYAAYDQAARLLAEAAAARPKSVRLRAAAAELLARSVVVRRGERNRIARAEAILAEINTTAEPPPELLIARGWVALSKGNLAEATRLAAGAAGDPGAPLLAGWTQLAAGDPAGAARTFESAQAGSPAPIALRYGLGCAQEEGSLPAAAADTYKAVVAQSRSHFGAALAVIRTGSFPAQSRSTLAEALIAKQAADASRTELADAQVLVGRAARQLGKVDQSDAAYRRALTLDPADPAALVATGEALLEQGKIKEAIAKFSAAAPNAPVAPVAAPVQDLRFAMAAVLIEKGQSKPGLALLGAPGAAAQGPADPRALFWRARAAELGTPPDLSAARHGYEETLKADPRFVPATLQLAALLVQQRRGGEGLAVLRRAEAAGAPAAALQLALGQAFLASGDVARAKKTFTDALGANPKVALARLGLAAALEAGGDAAAAKSELETVLAQAPETPGLRQRMAELLVAQGQKPQALAVYQAEIAAGKASPGLKMAAAKLALETGRTDVAGEIADKIVADAPETPGALVLLGRIRRASGDLRGAVAELRRALAFESSPELHFEYGRALVETGNAEEGLAELELAPSLPAAAVERARIFLRRGDADRAVGPLEAAVKQTPGIPDGWLLLGNAYDRLGTPAKAEAAWKSAIKADPIAPEPHYRLGRLQMDQGMPGPALGQLRLAASRVPADGPWTADFYFQLGFAEKAKGNRPAAIAALKRYLTIAPADAPSRHEVDRLLASLGP